MFAKNLHLYSLHICNLLWVCCPCGTENWSLLKTMMLLSGIFGLNGMVSILLVLFLLLILHLHNRVALEYPLHPVTTLVADFSESCFDILIAAV